MSYKTCKIFSVYPFPSLFIVKTFLKFEKIKMHIFVHFYTPSDPSFKNSKSGESSLILDGLNDKRQYQVLPNPCHRHFKYVVP